MRPSSILLFPGVNSWLGAPPGESRARRSSASVLTKYSKILGSPRLPAQPHFHLARRRVGAAPQRRAGSGPGIPRMGLRAGRNGAEGHGQRGGGGHQTLEHGLVSRQVGALRARTLAPASPLTTARPRRPSAMLYHVAPLDAQRRVDRGSPPSTDGVQIVSPAGHRHGRLRGGGSMTTAQRKSLMNASSMVSTGLARHARPYIAEPGAPQLGGSTAGSVPGADAAVRPAPAGRPVELGMRRKFRQCRLLGMWAEVLSVSMVGFLQYGS